MTVTGPTAGGFLTAYPTGATRPTASNLNFTAGQTVANLVTVKVGDGGAVTFYNLDGTTDVVVDVVGYYSGSATAGTYTPLTPGRLLDTRSGPQHKGFSTLGTGTTGSLAVRGGTTGVPVDADAVVLNVTATGTTAAGFVTVYPTTASPNPRPVASNLNFVPGQTVANLVTVQIGFGGTVSLYNHTGSTDLVADVVGYFSDGDVTGGAFHPLSPSRVLDTRPGSGHQVFTALGTGQHGDLTVAGVSPVPDGATAVIGNLTATEPTIPGFLTAYPTAAPPNNPPTASNLNFLAGQTVPNLAAVKLGLGGKLSIYNLVGTTQVLYDLAGWYG